MEVTEFLKRFDRIKDIKFKEIVGYGKTNPVNSRDKFINSRKNGVNVVQWLKPIIQVYILSCGSEAFTKYPNDVVKFMNFQLERRREAIQELIKIVKVFGVEKEITPIDICKKACRITFCEQEFKDKEECSRNICNECTR